MEWIRVTDRLPNHGDYILFVVYSPAFHDVTEELAPEDRDFPEEIKTVFGWFANYGDGKMYWSFADEFGDSCIKNECNKEYTGQVQYVTHWMPLPEPPKED